MKVLFKILRILGAGALLVVLALVIWQPVFPSVWIIQRMADSIDPRNVPLDPPTGIRFELTGKGGGIYNIVVDEDSVKTVKGNTPVVDLVLFMEARDFNGLMFSLAGGEVDEFMFRSLIISKVLRFAGDMSVFEKLFENEGVSP